MHFSLRVFPSVSSRLHHSFKLHSLINNKQGRFCHYSSPLAVKRKHVSSVKVKNFDILGTWDSRVELPLELESSINLGRPIPQILISAVGSHSVQGR